MKEYKFVEFCYSYTRDMAIAQIDRDINSYAQAGFEVVSISDTSVGAMVRFAVLFAREIKPAIDNLY